MIDKEEFPPAVISAINNAVNEISAISSLFWDDAVGYIIMDLKKKAENLQRLEGSRFLADVQEHIELEQDKQLYLITKRRTHVQKYS